MSWRSGENLGHYRLIEQIGRGGMGVVWKALDTRLGREVALKAIPPELADDPERLRLFRAEARSVAAVSHPGIVTIFSVEEHADRPFMTLELVSGETLDRIIDRGRLSVDQVLRLGGDLVDAVAAAHRQGIVHGDLKPANLMVGDGDRIKVLDFGLARIRERSEPTSQDATTTAAGTRSVAGSLPYMAPEQLLGQPADPRADLFAIGVILYEILAGSRPFRGSTPGELVPAIIRDDPEPLARRRDDVPEPLEQLVHRCLAKEPAERFSTADELHAALATLARRRQRDSLAAELAIPLPTVETDASRTAIAVLPFEDGSPERDQAHLCEGLAEDILDALARVAEIRTASRTRAAQLAARGHDPVEVGRRLHVDYVLGGSVRKSEDRLRVSVRLIEVAGESSVWSERFDRGSRDIFEVQDEIADTIVERLQGLDSGASGIPARTTRNAEAYELYLKGRYFWNQRYAGGLERALEQFGRAVEIDPEYALAYVGIADCYLVLGHYAYADPAHAYPEARSAAERALELAPDLGEAHASMAWIRAFRDYRREEASRHFRRMFEAHPSYATGYEWYGLFLISEGRFDDAVTVLRRAAQLDPVALIIPSIRAYALHCAGLARDSERVAQQALEMNPDFMFANLVLGVNRLLHPDLGDGLPAIRKAAELSGDSPLLLGYLGYALGLSGRGEDARAVETTLDELARHRYVPDLARALVHHGIGDRERTLDALEAAVAARDSFLVTAQSGPTFAALHEEPRYRKLLARMGLSP